MSRTHDSGIRGSGLIGTRPRTVNCMAPELSLAFALFLFVVLGVLLAHRLTSSSHLGKFPGPTLAKYSNLWRLIKVWRGDSHKKYWKLHERYGRIVRIGPNCIDVSDSSLIQTIYGSKRSENVWKKSKFYQAYNVLAGGKFVESQFNSWDTLGEMTFSHSFGLLEGQSQYEEILGEGDYSAKYLAVIGQMPWLNHLLGRNPVPAFRVGAVSFSSARKFVAASLAGRLDGTDGHRRSANPDFLDSLLDVQSFHSKGEISDRQICSWLSINVIAGTETTAITLRAAVYFLAANRIAQEKLHGELLETEEASRWKTCYKLVYLDAVVKETLRLHPAIGLSLERVVPEGGILLSDNRYIPEAITIGMNPYVLQQDESIFGDNATEFRPERWLLASNESYEAYQLRVSKMKASQLVFGRRINGPAGGTTPPVFLREANPTQAPPSRRRQPEEPRNIFLRTNITPTASGSAYLELPNSSIPSSSRKSGIPSSSLIPFTSTLKLHCTVHGPRPLPRSSPFSPQLVLTAHVKYAPFASRGLRRGFVRDLGERDTSARLETALRGIVIAERWPKSGVDVRVNVLEAEDEERVGSGIDGGHGGTQQQDWGAMTVLAGCVNVGCAAMMQAGIDCVDLVLGGVAALVRQPRGPHHDGGSGTQGLDAHNEGDGQGVVLDPCPAEYRCGEILAACVVAYLPARDELVDVWMKGDTGSFPTNRLIDSAVDASEAARGVLGEVVRESVEQRMLQGDGEVKGEIHHGSSTKTKGKGKAKAKTSGADVTMADT
ncbi:MAG: 3'-5'-exoribonuclease [Alyxoria varia]|nr:MAG: 3'-5'-exoribonuclease [Alyxoria varia]